MGLAKDRLFGKKEAKQGELRPVDLAYGNLTGGGKKDAKLLAQLRLGHLCHPETKAQLPKYAHFEEEITIHVKRLLALPKRESKPYENPQITEEQQTAISNALKHPLSLLTGTLYSG